jgi:hypothetical protein
MDATTSLAGAVTILVEGKPLPDCRLCRHYSFKGCGSVTVCSLGSNFVPATPVRFYPLRPLAGSQKT